jgi:hypothetical protein
MEASTKPRATSAEAAGGRAVEGHGRRLTRALEALEVFPALAESRDRLLRLAGEERPSTGAMVNAVESDPALAISVLRMANRPSSARSGKVLSLREAVELLRPLHRGDAGRAHRGDRLLRAQAAVGRRARALRLHALAVQRVADRIAREIDHPNRDELLVPALLHDIGKLVLLQAHPATPRTCTARRARPRRGCVPSWGPRRRPLARGRRARAALVPPEPACDASSSAITATRRLVTRRSSASRTCSPTT